jgi:hypothetical protein
MKRGHRRTEQRKFARTRIDVAVEFMHLDSPEPFEGTARDISLGGMFVVTDRPAPLGVDLVVTIVLPGAMRPAVLPGVVRWNAHDGMGIQFGALDRRETDAIVEAQARSG